MIVQPRCQFTNAMCVQDSGEGLCCQASAPAHLCVGGPDQEGPLAEVDMLHIFCEQLRSPPLCLLD